MVNPKGYDPKDAELVIEVDDPPPDDHVPVVKQSSVNAFEVA